MLSLLACNFCRSAAGSCILPTLDNAHETAHLEHGQDGEPCSPAEDGCWYAPLWLKAAHLQRPSQTISERAPACSGTAVTTGTLMLHWPHRKWQQQYVCASAACISLAAKGRVRTGTAQHNTAQHHHAACPEQPPSGAGITRSVSREKGSLPERRSARCWWPCICPWPGCR